MVLNGSSGVFSLSIDTGSFSINRQQTVIIIIEITKGGNIILKNSVFEMLNFVYKYKFCGLPKGVSIPPRFAAMFCIIKVNAIYLFLPVVLRTYSPKGKNVSSAISLAMSIEPIKVIYTSARTAIRIFLKICMIFLARV